MALPTFDPGCRSCIDSISPGSMIPSFLKFPFVSSASVAAVANAALAIDPEAFRGTALTWIAVGSTVFFALIAAASQLIPKVFAVLAKYDEFVAERRARRRALAAAATDVDLQP